MLVARREDISRSFSNSIDEWRSAISRTVKKFSLDDILNTTINPNLKVDTVYFPSIEISLFLFCSILFYRLHRSV